MGGGINQNKRMALSRQPNHFPFLFQQQQQNGKKINVNQRNGWNHFLSCYNGPFLGTNPPSLMAIDESDLISFLATPWQGWRALAPSFVFFHWPWLRPPKSKTTGRKGKRRAGGKPVPTRHFQNGVCIFFFFNTFLPFFFLNL